MLSLSQQKAFSSFEKGENLFLSGEAGSGKSFLIKHFQKYATDQGKKIQVTAMTGCAALLLNKATTLHSWAGIGIGTGTIPKMISNIKKYNKLKKWLETDILVIDEISMMSKKLFDILDEIGKKLRKNKKPFGGIQLVCSGDFHQLPPVEDEFCFESDLWNITFQSQVILVENFRQKGDIAYQTILNEIRQGTISPESCKLLIECTKKVSKSDIKPTLLYPTKKYADQVNQFENLTLDTEGTIYNKMYQSGEMAYILAELEKQKGMFEETITLKIGSQVMCIANLDQEAEIVNGSQGVIIGFDKGNPIVKFNKATRTIEPHIWKNDKYEDYGIQQIPLILSWAITIHKAQGITLDEACINIGSSVFEYGQTYVALSRIKTLDGLYIKSLDISKIKANPKVIAFYKNI